MLKMSLPKEKFKSLNENKTIFSPEITSISFLAKVLEAIKKV